MHEWRINNLKIKSLVWVKNWEFKDEEFNLSERLCRAPLYEEYAQHHEHKGDPGVTLGTCGVIGERAQVILVWVRTPSVENDSHPRRLWFTKVKPWAKSGLWRLDSKMSKITLIGGVS